MAALPDVESSGMMSTEWRGITFSVTGRPIPPVDRRPEAAYAEASASLFSTLRIPLKRGRYLSQSDRDSTPWVIVINETFARRWFPNEDPIGRYLLLRYESYHIDEVRPREIVGVVGDVKFGGRGNAIPPMAYSSYLQQPAVFPGGCVLSHLWQTIVTRTRAKNQQGFAAAIKKAAVTVDPDQPVTDIMSMDRFLDAGIDDTRSVMRLLEVFAGLALLLAITGIYGVMSYFVNKRTHEIGIRIALGAERANELRLVTGLGLKLTLIGVAAGVVLAMALTRLIARFLFGVSPADPATFATVAVVLVIVAVLACYVPARRAMKVDPMVALRDE